MDESPLDLSSLRPVDSEATTERVMSAMHLRIGAHAARRDSAHETRVSDVLTAYARPVLIAAGLLAMVGAGILWRTPTGATPEAVPNGAGRYSVAVDPMVAEWLSRRGPTVGELLMTFEGY